MDVSESQAEGWNSRLNKQRRAVVFADLAESVRLMTEHEDATISRWRRFAAQAREQLVPRHGGRLVRTAGDALLIVSPEPTSALAIAFALHESLESLNQGLAAPEQLHLRIGVQVADVVLDENEAYGAGVNEAARLASLVQPSETALGHEARMALTDGLHAEFEDLGLRYLKHLTVPLRAYRARPPGVDKPMLCAPANDELLPVIAVVPFVAVPADPMHDALGHAMADDVIAALARHPGLRVLSRASTQSLRGGDPEAVRRLTGAAYLLSGRYYVRGERVRLSAELCSLPDQNVLWAGQLQAGVDELFASEDQLVPALVAEVLRCAMAHSLGRVRSLPMDSLSSYALFLGASGLLNSLVRRDFLLARDVLQHLMERHPRQAAPRALMARWHVFRALQGWSDGDLHDGERAAALAHQAIEMNPAQAVAHAALAQVRLNFDADPLTARRHAERAIDADPSEPHGWVQLSAALAFSDDAGAGRESRRAATRALQVSPLDPSRYLFESYAAMAALADGSAADAVAHARQSLRAHALHAPSHRLHMAALWLGGQQTDARQAYLAFQQHCPGAPLLSTQRLRGLGGGWRRDYEDALAAVAAAAA